MIRNKPRPMKPAIYVPDVKRPRQVFFVKTQSHGVLPRKKKNNNIEK